jgi:hypothetical protein
MDTGLRKARSACGLMGRKTSRWAGRAAVAWRPAGPGKRE